MITIAYIDDDNCTVSGDEIWQYDYGQQMTITGLPSLPSGDVTQVHFGTNKISGTAYAVEAEVQGSAVVVDIPDLILTSGVGEVWCFVFVCDADDGETVYRVHFPVIRRPKPNIYNEDKAYEHMFARTIAKVTAAATEASEAVEAAQEVLDSIPSDYTELSRRVLALYPTETASGSVVAFDDGADDIPVKSLSVALEPVQDLHGYDAPWPAGGGVNQFPESAISGTINGVTVTQGGGSYSLTGTASAYTQFVSTETFTLEAGTYTLKEFNWASGLYVQLRSTDGQTTYASTAGAETNGFTLASDTELKVRIIVNASTATNRTIQIEVVSGSTAPTSFAPHSNICPISGWDAVNVVRCGKNLVDIADVTISRTDYAFNVSGLNIPAGQYTFRLNVSNASNISAVSFAAKNSSGSNMYSDSSKERLTNGITFTVNDTIGGIALYAQITSAVTFSNIQLEVGSTATAYEPYTATTYPISLTSAGTVYGGTLDVTSGELTVDRAMVTEEAFTIYGSSSNVSGGGLRWFNTNNLTPAPETGVRGISSMLPWVTNGWADRTPCIDSYSTGVIRIYDDSSSDESFRAKYSGLEVVYPLATPTTYHLTPTEITTLLGNNTVWSDAGDTTIIYRADPQRYFA